MEPPIGLVAGQGRLPVLTAQGIRATGRRVACVALRHQCEADLAACCDTFATAGIVQLGRWIRLMRRWGVNEAVMVGRVTKARMYDPLRILRLLPDWRAARLWYRKLRHDRRNDALLTAVADELAGAGITLIDSTKYIPEHLAQLGVMTRCQPTGQQLADIEFALPIIRQIGALDVGQSIAVKEREIIAVEAIEGTDAMIRRAGELCRSGHWSLVKVAKPNQDMRFDVPAVGTHTITAMKQCSAACLAVEANKVILMDKSQLLEAADQGGIAVVGVGTGSDQ